MKRFGRFSRGLSLTAVLLSTLGAALAGGCDTYHYYDITINSMSPVTVIETSSMNFCQVLVSGAASDNIPLTMNVGCPPVGSGIGTIEYATFADSGNITFTFNGYSQQVDPAMLCTTASKTLQASDTITQMATITLTSFNDTNCPPHVTTGTP